VRLFAVNYAIERRQLVCGMLRAEADGMPDDVTEEAADFFELDLTSLASAFAYPRSSGRSDARQRTSVVFERMLLTLERAMVMGCAAAAFGKRFAVTVAVTATRR
jgi:hypothetical protein